MDSISTPTLFGILFGLVFLSAYFSSSETGMMSINRYRLRHQVKNKNKAAKRVDKLLQRPDRLIGLILIGNNLVNIAASAIATIIGIRLYGDAGIAVATFALTLIVLIFAEVTPKTVAALHPERVAFPSSLILSPLLKILYPFVWMVNMITNGMLRLLGVNPDEKTVDQLSSDELRSIVSETTGMIPQKHQDMLTSILDLEKVTVEDIMVQRSEIAGIDINDDWKSIQKQLRHIQHTRILLFRDKIDDAVGFIHARDLMHLQSKDQFDKSNLIRSVRELYFIPEATSLNVQLLKFQENKERIGLVVDEYGDIQGLVTLEDILEEIVGDFTTNVTPTVSDEIQLQEDGSYIVEGSMNIREMNREMNWHFPIDGPKTVNGLLLEHFQDIPEPGISIRLAGYPLEVIGVDNNKVQSIRIIPAFYQAEKCEDEEDEE
ncbi:HlyC/CorC family transporter [Psychrobium sp. 1_MG-2023]|uniref:HlyC/CorC family transporter n=1 Tax=Psychrobium sp. 1_MG-2023 TaxID=3062624 RepID=UPI002734F736|nr:CNNM domain-containing protein [Psychrobium sp. 1_MG-2023]MDP2562046.1 CNNM domain-containing protein [Psychrobium sp. 1_MG-2023]